MCDGRPSTSRLSLLPPSNQTSSPPRASPRGGFPFTARTSGQKDRLMKNRILNPIELSELSKLLLEARLDGGIESPSSGRCLSYIAERGGVEFRLAGGGEEITPEYIAEFMQGGRRYFAKFNGNGTAMMDAALQLVESIEDLALRETASN